MTQAVGDEHSLVERARAGDADAFTQLVTESRDVLWSVCLRITADPQDAEDALQDTLIAAWQNIHKFRGNAKFSTWCYRIAANASIAVCRKRRSIPIDTDDIVDLVVVADTTGQVDDRDLVTAALREVGEDFREALVLREYGDMTYDEIAAHQGIGVQTVKSRISRARAQLAEAVRSASA
ncbi:MAG: sigma-70 family RNA polymerase sigma factor [Aeromicrobium sp.]|uniref:RNA polymerase sigma factor n=1 Tax=Aeromicrobium sp. TaxID=1871063 RepID=UPI0025B7E8C9|nr:sigma-70 family RNA polymerase sigma factor [Aeromicrobium sp.]MCK5892171.1 sigma-70 family RNA polymerase sigma factor [Aeromicrobium sp.]MDF1704168.1 sigma-70 family RNA polymerase sigma factor [Aeromicrobium sp.]